MAEANGVRGEYKVLLGDKEFVIVPSFRRIAKLETALGRSLIRFASDLSVGGGLTVLEVVTFFDVMARDPKLSRDEVGDLVLKHGVVAALPFIQGLIERVVNGGGGADGNPPSEDASNAD